MAQLQPEGSKTPNGQPNVGSIPTGNGFATYTNLILSLQFWIQNNHQLTNTNYPKHQCIFQKIHFNIPPAASNLILIFIIQINL
jgi:hypothetical protein